MIVLRGGTYRLQIEGTGEDSNADGDIDIDSPVVIRGRGPAKTTINGRGNVLHERIFDVHSGNAVFRSLMIRNGDESTSGVDGGAIRYLPAGGLTIRNAAIHDNQAYDGGGVDAQGGAKVVVISSRFTDNDSDNYGGGVYSYNTDGTLTVRKSVFNGNNSVYQGSAISAESQASVDVVGTRIQGNGSNDASYGGGISAYGVDEVTIKTSTVTGNWAGYYYGGGVYVYDAESTQIDRSTVSSNFADGYGGGVYLDSGGETLIRNSTISRNEAGQESGYAGGIYAYDDTQLRLRNATVYHNLAYNNGAGVYAESGATVDYKNSIIARNRLSAGGSNDCAQSSATVSSAGRNVLGDDTCPSIASDVAGTGSDLVDPALGPLARNGGPTPTHALLPGSPALGNGAGCLKIDQRGVSRPPKCDSGAFER